jgi:F-type H+-transporting ATPase subunit b
MEQTLHALAGILLRAIPTVIIVLLLHWYLKAMLFQPLAKVLKQREEATAGARHTAEESLQTAAKRAADFDKALIEARAEVYREQESQRKQWLEDQAAQIRTAKESGDRAVSEAQANLKQESAVARQTLADTSSSLADEITRTVLRGAHA